jgi:hypothetical protein
MSGPPPKQQRRRRNSPAGGEWQASPGIGWQHGPIPAPPDGLLPASIAAWEGWFRSWFASHWRPHDVPALDLIIKMFDRVSRGAPLSHSRELARWMADYGISPKGQQARHWLSPTQDEIEALTRKASDPVSRYAHLRLVDERRRLSRPAPPKGPPPGA